MKFLFISGCSIVSILVLCHMVQAQEDTCKDTQKLKECQKITTPEVDFKNPKTVCEFLSNYYKCIDGAGCPASYFEKIKKSLETLGKIKCDGGGEEQKCKDAQKVAYCDKTTTPEMDLKDPKTVCEFLSNYHKCIDGAGCPARYFEKIKIDLQNVGKIKCDGGADQPPCKDLQKLVNCQKIAADINMKDPKAVCDLWPKIRKCLADDAVCSDTFIEEVKKGLEAATSTICKENPGTCKDEEKARKCVPVLTVEDKENACEIWHKTRKCLDDADCDSTFIDNAKTLAEDFAGKKCGASTIGLSATLFVVVLISLLKW